MLATRLADEDAVRNVTWREGGHPIGVLPAAGVFGANASGKTNVIKAMDDMRAHVLHSFRAGSPTGGISRRPYLLEPDRNSKPSRFEADLVLSGVCYQYGFVIDDESVQEEWAYHYPHGMAAWSTRLPTSAYRKQCGSSSAWNVTRTGPTKGHRPPLPGGPLRGHAEPFPPGVQGRSRTRRVGRHAVSPQPVAAQPQRGHPERVYLA